MRSVLFGLLFLLLSCGDTDLGGSLEVAPPGGDVQAPALSGSVSVSTNSGVNQTATMTWTAATDNVAITLYEVAVAVDSGDGNCTAADFSTSTINWHPMPTSTDFSGSGYQIQDSDTDNSGATLSVSLRGEVNYCSAVRALDEAGNTSDVIYSSVWNFNYVSCLERLQTEPTTTDGVYLMDPDGAGGSPAYSSFCDMTTQGGGWTLVIKYDSAQASAGSYALDAGAGRGDINATDLTDINATGNLTASVDVRPFVTNGATHFMHVGKTDDAATDSSTYVRVYFSEIYQVVIDTPANLFDSSLDSNNATALIGTAVSPTSAVRKDRWFEPDFTPMTVPDTDGDTSNVFVIDGGEGDAMFTNGNREGAVYTCGNSSGAAGHGDPKVQWGFRGADGSQQSYGGAIYIGTFCSSALTGCVPESQINMMFVR